MRFAVTAGRVFAYTHRMKAMRYVLMVLALAIPATAIAMSGDDEPACCKNGGGACCDHGCPLCHHAR